MFSKACEYGIRAIVYIAEQSYNDNRVNIKEIAKAIDSPEPFTAKILQILSRAGIVDSLKGPTGGFLMSHTQMDEIHLSHIVAAIDGDQVFVGCGLGLKGCSNEKPCPVHDKFGVIRNELRHMLETTSVSELAKGLKEGLTFLKR
jgi:Rrf2 family protein